jgi:hypothetical protein
MNIVSSSRFRDIPVEKGQSYWNVCPRNIRHARKPVGSEEYFHEVNTENNVRNLIFVLSRIRTLPGKEGP